MSRTRTNQLIKIFFNYNLFYFKKCWYALGSGSESVNMLQQSNFLNKTHLIAEQG